MTTHTTTKPPPRHSLQDDARSAFVAVRQALAKVVAAVPGELRRPTDLQRALEVDSKICWQIFKVIRAEDSLNAARYVPTVPALKRAMSAAARLGVAESAIAAVYDSVEAFEAVVERHADSRPDFEAMLSAIAPDDLSDQADLQRRREVYRGLSHIWGAQLDVFSTTMLLRRSELDATDEVLFAVKHGLRRLRPDACVHVYGARLAGPDQAPTPDPLPLDAAAAERHGAPLVEQFCTQPLPQFQTFSEGGWVYSQMADERIGRSSAVDLAFGGIARNVPLSRDTDGRKWVGLSALPRTPAGLLVNTLLVHRPSLGDVQPEHLIFANVPGSDAPSIMRRLTLPINESILSLGPADQLVPHPDLPGYTDMIAYGCRCAGWDLSEFDAFRVRITYPVLHSVSRLFFYVD